MWIALRESRLVSYLGLFSSLGTLVCCAIPATLVLLGFGATLAGFLGEYPQFIWLSENKGIVFGVSFTMLGLSYLSQRYAQGLSCPVDKKDDCGRTRSWSRRLLFVTALVNFIGAFTAFVLPKLL